MASDRNAVCWHCDAPADGTIYVGSKDDPVGICDVCANEEPPEIVYHDIDETMRLLRERLEADG